MPSVRSCCRATAWLRPFGIAAALLCLQGGHMGYSERVSRAQRRRAFEISLAAASSLPSTD
ncbi:hypothetical protein ACFOPN_13870 [Xanthomonas hyacinthi]